MPATKRRRRRRISYDKTVGLLLISPWLVGMLLFKLLPILASLALSFTDFYLLEPGATRFIGLENLVLTDFVALGKVRQYWQKPDQESSQYASKKV